MTLAPDAHPDAVLRVDGLRKRYGDTEVVRGLAYYVALVPTRRRAEVGMSIPC